MPMRRRTFVCISGTMGGQDSKDTENDPKEMDPPEEEDEGDEADLVDPMDTLKEQCRLEDEALRFKEILQSCEARITAKTEEWEERGLSDPYPEHCQQELVDYVVSVDKCVAKTLFTHLK